MHQIVLSLLKADKENFDSIVDTILSIPLKRNQSHSCRLHGFTNNQILKINSKAVEVEDRILNQLGNDQLFMFHLMESMNMSWIGSMDRR